MKSYVNAMVANMQGAASLVNKMMHEKYNTVSPEHAKNFAEVMNSSFVKEKIAEMNKECDKVINEFKNI